MSAFDLESGTEAGTLLFPSPQLVQDPSKANGWDDELCIFDAFGRLHEDPARLVEPGQPGSDVLFLMGINPNDEESLMAIRLGDMTTEAVANHFPEHAKAAAKPKVFFRGGRTGTVSLVLAHVSSADAGADGSGDAGDIAVLTPMPDDPDFSQQLDGRRIISTRFFQGVELIDLDYTKRLLEAGLLECESASVTDIFTPRPAETWRNIMKRRPYPQNLFSAWAANPQRN